ncbi:MAG: RNA polymerase sigma factor RpoE [Legionellales bacterium]|nr:MAG: RNA polymerase sigma factor RpoE [Legionellales bacterium]
MKQQSDLLIIEEIKSGNTEAFNSLVLKYQPRIAKIAAQYSKEPSDIMDITQEAFIKIYKAITKFRGDSAFYTWIYRITVNTAKNYISAQKRRLPVINFHDASQEELFLNTNMMCNIDDPEHLLLRDEIAANLDNVVATMSDELRTAILLRELDGMSYDEIAGIMHCPVGTVRSRIHRARAAIDIRVDPFMEA